MKMILEIATFLLSMILLSPIQVFAVWDVPTFHGNLVVSENGQKLSAHVRVNAQEMVPIQLPDYTPSAAAVFKDLNGMPVDTRADGSSLEIAASKTIDGVTKVMILYENGAYIRGFMEFDKGFYTLSLPTKSGFRQLALVGPLTEKPEMDELIRVEVAVEGIFVDKGKRLHVTRISPVKKEIIGQTNSVLLTGTLNKGTHPMDHKGTFYIQGQNERRWWLGESAVKSYQSLLGEEVLVVGEDLRGKIDVKSIEEYEPVKSDDENCTSSLLNQFLKKRKKH